MMPDLQCDFCALFLSFASIISVLVVHVKIGKDHLATVLTVCRVGLLGSSHRLIST